MELLQYSVRKSTLKSLLTGVLSPSLRYSVVIHLTKDYYGGKLFYEVNRDKNAVPDYYFTKRSHTNFYHPYVHINWKSLICSEGVVVLSTDWILDSLAAQALLPCRYYTVTGVPPCPPTWSINLM
jgi:hypothetical protein